MTQILVDKQHRDSFFAPTGDVTITLTAGAECELLLCGVGDGKITASLSNDSSLKIVTVEVDAENLNREIEINLEGQGAFCEIGSISLVGGEVRKSIKSLVNHRVPNCESKQNFRSVATDSAVSSFSGLIYVAQGADQTLALQQSDNVLLSDTAKIFTDPQMEIYADDVKCNHGATVGRRDEQALFYMRQRGIPERDAQGLLMESFCFASLAIDNFSEDIQQRVRDLVVDAISKL